MKDLKSYKLKITTLTPVHIGTGDVYEPTNFVIDDGFLYEFDEILFYKALGDMDKKSFDSKLGDYMQIIDFYKDHKELAKKIYISKIKVSKKTEETYNKVKNRDGTKNKNQLEIQKIYKNPNTNNPVIPGSSIKGMFDTILRIYPRRIAENSIRQDLIISDAFILDGSMDIGYCYRRHKNPEKRAKNPIPQIVEIIRPKSTFIFSIDTKFDFKDIKDNVTMYFEAPSRKNKYFKSDKDSFVTRIGKFSGKAFMVDNGVNVLNNDRKPVATHTLYEDDSPFGWIKIELIDQDRYKSTIDFMQENTKSYFDDLQTRQKGIREYLKIKKKRKEQEKLDKEQKLKQEKLEKEQEERARQEKLSKLSPFERKIDEIIKNHQNKNDTKDVIAFNAFQDGQLEDFRCEALRYIKSLMIELKKWVETSKKPQKDKKYKRTQEVIKMLEKCKEL